jgi:hypothetical protein
MEGFHLNIPQNVQLVTDLKNNKSVWQNIFLFLQCFPNTGTNEVAPT